LNEKIVPLYGYKELRETFCAFAVNAHMPTLTLITFVDTHTHTHAHD